METIEITRVDEPAAQRLADATGRVVYKSPNWIASWGCRGTTLTTDRDEAVAWGESVAFVPQRPLADYANKTFVVPKDAVGMTGYPFHWVKKDGSEEPFGEPEPEPQLRVVRVLELRGPQSWMEKALANSWVSETEPRHGKGPGGAWEIVEQIRITERLCRWCGGEHLGACSEDACSANPAVQRHRSGK